MNDVLECELLQVNDSSFATPSTCRMHTRSWMKLQERRLFSDRRCSSSHTHLLSLASLHYFASFAAIL